MPLISTQHCWRGRDDCVAFQSIEGVPAGTTEEQFYELDFKPTSFVCCGCVKPEARGYPQDAYRLCFKNDATDEMTDNDEQDLTHILGVVSHSLAIIASRRVQSGRITVPGQDVEMTEVKTMQGPEVTP